MLWIVLCVFVLISAACIIMIMPRTLGRADMEYLRCDYAHRGLWGEDAPENSLASFARAKDAGYGIELDIQLSKDKKIMVFHDYTLLRMCGKEGKLSDYTCAELQAMKLRGSEEGIPTLAEVLNLVGGKVPLLIELKGESSDTELCPRAAAMLDKYRGAFCIESFNPLLLAYFKKHRPNFARGQLVTCLLGKKVGGRSGFLNFLLTNLLLNILSRPDFIAVDAKIRNTLPVHICESIFRADVFVWTVSSEKDMNACYKEGRKTIFEGFIPGKRKG